MYFDCINKQQDLVKLVLPQGWVGKLVMVAILDGGRGQDERMQFC